MSVWSLFYGQQGHKAVSQKGGGWTLPMFKIELRRSDWIPWPIKNIQGAHMVMRDENGNVVGHYDFEWDSRIDRENDILWLGSKHVNRRGELFINVYDEVNGSRTDIIDLATGRPIVPTDPVTARVAIGFTGLVTLPNNSNAIFSEASDEQSQYYCEYTQVTDVKVTYNDYRGILPRILVADAEDLPKGEDAWTEIDSGIHRIEAGRRLFFRFDWGKINTTPIPYPNDGPGKGIAVEAK